VAVVIAGESKNEKGPEVDLTAEPWFFHHANAHIDVTVLFCQLQTTTEQNPFDAIDE